MNASAKDRAAFLELESPFDRSSERVQSRVVATMSELLSEAVRDGLVVRWSQQGGGRARLTASVYLSLRRIQSLGKCKDDKGDILIDSSAAVVW